MTAPRDIGDMVSDRLPQTPFVSIPDVCVALDLDDEVVQGWIDSGEVEACDFGGKKRHHWKIVRPSLISFVRRRSLGLRMPAEKSLKHQAELFADASFGKAPPSTARVNKKKEHV